MKNLKVKIIFFITNNCSYVEKDEFDLTPVLKENYSLSDLKKSWMASGVHQKSVFISAKTGENVEELRNLLHDEVKKIHLQRYPQNTFPLMP